ncbi:hypothetical protein [Isoptericola variabilis]|uniref:Transcriptional regulator, AbiEi antitoxin, Type IV TA system n=1 Tax=Isoptericola variabilis (strain 225) TaxID=743718 RepID=F6FR89_ISOV2|nr:hypothetical protein [Isoptericola variabilis]AEG42949.1 hypothetical protein Isova_0138 [Isoptericola variabilis 225]TWH31799.1 Transcriptional regulator, AbiEi antitoxin, Type IV TA system [Isoptericola variabilis J7]
MTAAHVPAIHRISRILATMRAPDSPLRTMLSAALDGPPAVPEPIDLSLVSTTAVARRVQDGTFQRVRPGVYLSSAEPPSDSGYVDRLLAEVRGVNERASGRFWFSHATAALLHGGWLYDVPELVHVTHTFHPHVARDDEPRLRRHHTTLPERDRAEVGGIPVTSIERTLVDCARSLQPTSAVVAADSLFRLGADPAIVSRIMSESTGKRGIVQARRTLEVCDPRSGSPGESASRVVAVDDGLPRPECQIEVATVDGTFFVDFGWEDVRLAVEFDGAVKYSGGEYGDPDRVRYLEAVRQRALEAAGWIVIRVRWEELADPLALGLRIRREYERARYRRRARDGRVLMAV